MYYKFYLIDIFYSGKATKKGGGVSRNGLDTKNFFF